MSQNIKNNLFRFVTLRSPQLIDEKEDHPGFVYHPEEPNRFLSAVENQQESDKKALLQQEADAFTGSLKTINDVKQLNPALYLFSSWLMRNKNALSYDEINANSESVSLLTTSEIVVWENLIYQTISKTSVHVREALIRLLIANQFLGAFNDLSGNTIFTEAQDKEFTRRSNASVVMPKALFSKTTEEVVKSGSKLSELQIKAINNEADIALAKDRISDYKLLIEELDKEEVIFNKANQKAYDIALNQYNEDVETLIGNTTPVIVQLTDSETGEIVDVKTYPNLVIPEFSYTPQETITKTYLATKLSDSAYDVFDNEGLEMYDTYTEVKNALKSKIKKENKAVFSKAKKSSGKVNVGGTYMRTSPTSRLPSTPYCFLVRKDRAPKNKSNVYMYLATPQNTQIVSATYNLELNSDSNVSYSSSDIRRVHGGGVSTHLGLILFESGLDLVYGTYTLTGQYTLSSGKTVDFDIDNFNISKLNENVTGCATIVGENAETELNNLESVYGITNLGVADFRRVEQEVCCYVPGEVSHIENVMAREYKERSTRSLTSVETTTEESRESEVENLADSTTTERNEMQSEVASVLNEDESQNYGANASVSSTSLGVTLSAGAYFDAASASATSNSNTQAQTYAQEVTERAMERVVQKISSKRTSRILREFEENNKHGFDNTKGETHVTGVYRWVDKIYKNKLINYGKRLMYEFAIPEPSKFFKEAIWKKIEKNEIDKDLIFPDKPIHPSLLEGELAMASSLDLDETNYQQIASEYNAEVTSALSEIITLSKSFKLDYNAQANDEASSLSDNIDITEGYEAISATARGRIFSDSGNGNNARINISVGNYNQDDMTVLGHRSFDYVYTFTDGIRQELAVSASTFDMAASSFNVSVFCERTTEAFEQWQNETYNAIMEAYQDRVNEYNDAQNQEIIQDGDTVKLKFNPLQNRAIEKRELKRIAIELLTEQKEKDVSNNNYSEPVETGGISKVNKGAALQKHISEVKFFEQAFDWEIMAYIFYPYFYADEKDWVELFQQQDAADPLFQTFLQSGMARTVVPVSPGFEDAVNWYMKTGEVWNGEGLVADQDDDLYVSVAEEMQTLEGEVEGTWETRLPTSLTILQAGGIGLDVDGLPCNPECDQDNPIVPSESLIGGDEGPDGVGSDAVSGIITVQ